MKKALLLMFTVMVWSFSCLQAHTAKALVVSSTLLQTGNELGIGGKFMAYPNPSNQKIAIKQIDDKTTFTLVIFDLAGRQLSTKVSVAGEPIEIRRDELGTGVFLIKVVKPNGFVWTDKIQFTD